LGFVTRRKRFQKLFENAFEILEKEKEIEIFFLLSFRPEGPASLLPPLLARSASSPEAQRAAQWAGPAKAAGYLNRALFSLRLTTRAALVSLPRRARAIAVSSTSCS
jgi:hypothetical protein